MSAQTKPEETPELPIYSPAEAAVYLRVSRQTIWRWVRDGSLPASRVGARYRIKQSDLDGMVKAA